MRIHDTEYGSGVLYEKKKLFLFRRHSIYAFQWQSNVWETKNASQKRERRNETRKIRCQEWKGKRARKTWTKGSGNIVLHFHTAHAIYIYNGAGANERWPLHILWWWNFRIHCVRKVVGFSVSVSLIPSSFIRPHTHTHSSADTIST